MNLSEQYRKVLEKEHASSEWGVTGHLLASQVHQIMTLEGLNTLLDYGCGQGKLGQWFAKNAPQMDLREYEPGIPRRAAMPDPAQIVACIDVMEHVEPEYVVNVLDHIQKLAQHRVYFNISTCLAGRILNDGRNAHLTIKPHKWWIALLRERWDETNFFLARDGKGFNWAGSVRT
jgi:2-polyprenyl-3-methyl-5-hydroxy-6-metoxy-1,4-benzoquinol methylase